MLAASFNQFQMCVQYVVTAVIRVVYFRMTAKSKQLVTDPNFFLLQALCRIKPNREKSMITDMAITQKPNKQNKHTNATRATPITPARIGIPRREEHTNQQKAICHVSGAASQP